MSSTYLLTWNPGKFAWDNFQDDWNAVYMGFRPQLRWSCGNTKRIHVHDRVFLMRLGWQEAVNGIVASGRVTEPSFVESHWNEASGSPTAVYIDFEPDVLLNPSVDDLLNPITVSQDFNWHPQRSGITIPSEIAARLKSIWQEHVERTNIGDQPPSQTDAHQSPFREGSRRLISSYRYERDPRARADCIEHYGTRCEVCGFEFGKEFGTIGAGFIHVHHLTPISAHDTDYEIDPIRDLRPVCPNCHAMLHRRSPPYSIEELRHIPTKCQLLGGKFP